MIIGDTWEPPGPANLMKGNQLIISTLEIELKLMNLILISSAEKARSMRRLRGQTPTNRLPC